MARHTTQSQMHATKVASPSKVRRKAPKSALPIEAPCPKRSKNYRRRSSSIQRPRHRQEAAPAEMSSRPKRVSIAGVFPKRVNDDYSVLKSRKDKSHKSHRLHRAYRTRSPDSREALSLTSVFKGIFRSHPWSHSANVLQMELRRLVVR